MLRYVTNLYQRSSHKVGLEMTDTPWIQTPFQWLALSILMYIYDNCNNCLVLLTVVHKPSNKVIIIVFIIKTTDKLISSIILRISISLISDLQKSPQKLKKNKKEK